MCGGKIDAEIIKLIYSRILANLELEKIKSIAISDCEGIDKLYGLIRAIALLARLSRRLSSLAVIVDADQFTFEERFRSLVNSLNSVGLDVGVSNDYVVNERVFKALVNIDGKSINLYVAVNGIVEYGFTRHILEDHVIKLLELEGKLRIDDIKELSRRGLGSSKEVIRIKGIDILMRLRRHMWRILGRPLTT